MTDYIDLADKMIHSHVPVPCPIHGIRTYDGKCQLCLMHARRVVPLDETQVIISSPGLNHG